MQGSMLLLIGGLAGILSVAAFMSVVSRAFRESAAQGFLALAAPGYTLHYCVTRPFAYRREVAVVTYLGGALALGLHLLSASR